MEVQVFELQEVLEFIQGMCLTSLFRKVPLFPSLILMPLHHQEEKAKISAFNRIIQYYVLFNIIAGPEAVLRQPLEDMKVF